MTRKINATWPLSIVGTWLMLLLFGCATGRTQPTAEVTDFFVDPVGKSYLLLADDRLVTDNPLGQNSFEFYDSSLGHPEVVDVSNPFAILLFYADFGTVVVLNRTLSEVSRIDLFSLEGLEQPVAVARASDNGIWVFDSWDYRLKLFDPAGRQRLASNDLRLEIGQSSEPSAIFVDRARVLLHYAESRKLAVFTNFGRFENWIALPPSENPAWYAPWFTGNSGEESWTWRVGWKEARTQVQKKVKGKVLTGNDGFYHLDENGRVVYSPYTIKQE